MQPVQWNEAGKRVNNLWTKEWRTNVSLTPKRASDNLKVKGFYGDYEMTLIYDGQEQWSHQFTLEKDKSVNIEVSI